jgi:FAD/FMN-containing dehydrogenase
MDVPFSAKAVVLPRSTQDVSNILKICHDHSQPVVMHGGLTGLAGGTEVSANEIVISLEKMKAIEDIDEKSRTITVEAGVILEEVHEAVLSKGLIFPLNFGAKGSAQIGGIVSTNAGGLRVFRYGMMRNLVLGLEVVLADGTIINSLKKIIKDNSAYDLKHMFIGSEGTLGVVTKAVLRLMEAPRSRNSAFVAFNEYEKVVSFLKYMDKGLAGTLSGFELIWDKAYEGLSSSKSSVKPPLPYGHQYYVLLESLGSHPEADRLAMEQLLSDALEMGNILDAVLAQSESDHRWFWTLREDVQPLLHYSAYEQLFDISLPTGLIGKILDTIEKEVTEISGVEHCFIFGHIADGNVHLVIGKNSDDQILTKMVNEAVYQPLKAIGGSVSAEHGIGVHKKQYLSYSRSLEEIELMKTLKKTLDPNNILNPGKIFI